MYIKFLYDSVKPQYTLAFFSIKNEGEWNINLININSVCFKNVVYDI